MKSIKGENIYDDDLMEALNKFIIDEQKEEQQEWKREENLKEKDWCS